MRARGRPGLGQKVEKQDPQVIQFHPKSLPRGAGVRTAPHRNEGCQAREAESGRASFSYNMGTAGVAGPCRLSNLQLRPRGAAVLRCAISEQTIVPSVWGSVDLLLIASRRLEALEGGAGKLSRHPT